MSEIFHYAIVTMRGGQIFTVEVADGGYPTHMQGKRGEDLKHLHKMPDVRVPGVYYFRRTAKQKLKNGKQFVYYEEI